MSGFKHTTISDVILCSGDMDCDAAHAALLNGLQSAVAVLLSEGIDYAMRLAALKVKS